MKIDEIRAVIIAAIRQIQEQSQREMPPVHGSTRLIGDVPGFDSLNAVELVILLSDALRKKCPNCDIPDCIVLGAGKESRPNLDEIAENVRQYLVTPKKKARTLNLTVPTLTVPNPIRAPESHDQKVKNVKEESDACAKV